jgi:hypothetical protein
MEFIGYNVEEWKVSDSETRVLSGGKYAVPTCLSWQPAKICGDIAVAENFIFMAEH